MWVGTSSGWRSWKREGAGEADDGEGEGTEHVYATGMFPKLPIALKKVPSSQLSLILVSEYI